MVPRVTSRLRFGSSRKRAEFTTERRGFSKMGTPPALAPHDDQSPVGYLLVGLGGLALGAAGAVSVRRVRPA
jgi:hypothetical protein